MTELKVRENKAAGIQRQGSDKERATQRGRYGDLQRIILQSLAEY